MRKYSFIVLAALAVGGLAIQRAPLLAKEQSPAQGEKMTEFEGARAGIEWLQRELKLTDAQKQQLIALDQGLEQQANDIRQNILLSPVDKKVRMAALHQGLETGIKAVLTSDQIQKFDQMGGIKALMSHGQPVGEGMRLKGPNGFEALNLTDAQKSAIEAIMAQSKQGFQAAEGDVTKLAALKLATQQRIMAVLTPAQQQQMAAASGFEFERGPGADMSMPDLSSLGLTPDQHDRLMAILAEGGSQARAIKEDKSLSDPQRTAMLSSLYQQFRPRVLTVLTPAQEQKLEALLLDPRR